MYPPNSSARRRKAQPRPELLESRALMTGGGGDTFAIMRGTIANPGDTTTINFTIDPAQWTLPKGKVALGIDVAPATNSSVQPLITSVNDPSSAAIPQTFHSIYNPHLPHIQVARGVGTRAVLSPLTITGDAPETFSVTVSGEGKSSGDFLLGFYLPGDADGDGTVTSADVQAIQAISGAKNGSAKYNFSADANRDGRIGPIDANYARQNLGVKTTINPMITAQLDPLSDSGLTDLITNIRNVHFFGTASPAAQVTFNEVNNKTPAVSTKADANGNYNINLPLADGVNNFNVSSTDAFGQTIQGLISPVTFDPNAPTAQSQTFQAVVPTTKSTT